MVRDWVKAAMPPAALALARRWGRRGLRFTGRPRDWADAGRMSKGYASGEILDRVVQATRAVVAGQAVFERDSVLFHEPDPPFALLAALLRVAAKNGGRLDVVDIGGSLGSTYRQCRSFLHVVREMRWHVVEQPNFVAAGRAEFESAELTFAASLDEVPPASEARVVLLSSVLQYLEEPMKMLDGLSAVGATDLVIDRTPWSDALATDRLCIQVVPPRIYDASYPCWIFSRQRLLDALERDWSLVCEFAGSDGSWSTDDGLDFAFRGLIMERRR
jgi:putative methyltransferase (TIGR04325 family)